MPKPYNAGATPANGFQRVFDRKGVRVRGMWIRGGVYYAQFRLPGENPRRVRLKARTLARAVEERFLVKGKPEGMPAQVARVHLASFEELRQNWLEWLRASDRAPGTVKSRSIAMDRWSEFLGPNAGLEMVDLPVAHRFLDWRLKKVGLRTAQNDVGAMRSLLSWAVQRGYMNRSGLEGWHCSRPRPKEVRLITAAQIDELCAGALHHFRNAGIMVDYIRLLQYSGGREQETIKLSWKNVDFEGRRLGFGQHQRSKFGRSRWMPFNPALESHLKEMHGRRRKDTHWMFPGRDGNPLTSLSNQLVRLKGLMGIEDFGWHHLRHYFISRAVMSGVDVRTLSDWVGHADRGVTIARTYAHLCEDHSRAQALRVVF